MTELQIDIADCMATVIVALIKACGDYSKDGLLRAGFTLEEIRRYERLAYSQAKVKLHNIRSNHAV